MAGRRGDDVNESERRRGAEIISNNVYEIPASDFGNSHIITLISFVTH